MSVYEHSNATQSGAVDLSIRIVRQGVPEEVLESGVLFQIVSDQLSQSPLCAMDSGREKEREGRMSNRGMGVMIGMLRGNEKSVNAFKSCIGKTIVSLKVEENGVRFGFADNTKLSIVDDGQSCCESRYMRTDDDLSKFVGGTLQSAEVKEQPQVENDYDVHEIAFLVVTTSKGAFTVQTHNEHNGYYGGFWIQAQLG